MSRLLIAGCGFLGEAAADFFPARGWQVVGLTGSAESAVRLADKPYAVQTVDLTDAGALAALRDREAPFDFVVHCASSGRGGAEAYERVYVQGCTQLATAFPSARLIFTGSTSVYAQTGGEWVDESSATEPDRETGKLLLAAERVTLAAGGVVLRLAGIYGPGRSVLLRKFVEGTARLEDGGGRWINQIHRDDAVRAIEAAMLRAPAGSILNVVDDEPATQCTVYGWIADFQRQPLPPSGPADLARKRGWTSKRVRNAQLRALGWTPEFPNYCSALPSISAALGASGVGAAGT